MGSLVPASFGAVSSKFKALPAENDLAAGIEASFFLMKYKGKVWTISHKGVDMPLMRPDGDGPRNSIDVVLVKSAKVKSKIYYEGGYTDGSKEAPTCFSTNGVTPDAGAAKKQSATCALCPRNVWGSRTTEAGKKGKECGDSKRVVIVPADATQPNPACLRNEALGGPGLLRVPAATLGALASYGDMMQQAGFPYQAIITRIAFDAQEAYPTFIFSAVRPLTDEEADVILELAGSTQVDRILAEDAPVPAMEQTPAPAFVAPLAGQVIAAPVAAPVAAPAPPPPPAPAPVAAPAPAPAPVSIPGFGAVAPAAAPMPTAQQSVAAPLVTPEVTVVPDPDFEKKLDALLA